MGDGIQARLRAGSVELADQGPLTALVSAALRTQQTADAVLSSLHVSKRLDLDALYGADGPSIVSMIEEEVAGGSEGVIVIGHNPGLTAAAHDLSGGAFADVLRPGDAVMCCRDADGWRFVRHVTIQADS